MGVSLRKVNVKARKAQGIINLFGVGSSLALGRTRIEH